LHHRPLEGFVLNWQGSKEDILRDGFLPIGRPHSGLTSHDDLARIFGETHVRQTAGIHVERAEAPTRRFVVARSTGHGARETQPAHEDDALDGALGKHGEATSPGGERNSGQKTDETDGYGDKWQHMNLTGKSRNLGRSPKRRADLVVSCKPSLCRADRPRAEPTTSVCLARRGVKQHGWRVT